LTKQEKEQAHQGTLPKGKEGGRSQHERGRPKNHPKARGGVTGGGGGGGEKKRKGTKNVASLSQQKREKKGKKEITLKRRIKEDSPSPKFNPNLLGLLCQECAAEKGGGASPLPDPSDL